MRCDGSLEEEEAFPGHTELLGSECEEQGRRRARSDVVPPLGTEDEAGEGKKIQETMCESEVASKREVA